LSPQRHANISTLAKAGASPCRIGKDLKIDHKTAAKCAAQRGRQLIR
jgi:hypothetical protein